MIAFLTVAFGDLDQDGDLDLVAPGGGLSPDSPDATPLVLRNDGNAWVPWAELGTEPLKSQAPLLTDRDNDGDLDLLLVNDLSTRTTFWKNHLHENGAVSWTEDANAVGMGLSMAGMGMDTADLNGDGTVDWCFSDVGPSRCFLSDSEGWYQAQSGLEPTHPTGRFGTTGWSLSLADLNNDGFVELLQASGQNSPSANDPGEGQISRIFFLRGCRREALRMCPKVLGISGIMWAW